MRKTAVRALLSGVAVLLFLSLVVLAQSPQGANISQFGDVRSQLSALALNPSITFEYGTPIKVVKVVDGDTLQLINGESVRYIGIDTPEKNDPRKPEQCYAREASARNAQLVEGKDVVIYKDISEKDKYGRWLGFIYLSDGTFVNETLVREGYALRIAPLHIPMKTSRSKSRSNTGERKLKDRLKLA